jgi:hypothetical protein
MITTLIAIWDIEDWSFGRILMAILLMNVVLFVVLTCAPGLHNSVTKGVKKFIDSVVPKSAKKSKG